MKCCSGWKGRNGAWVRVLARVRARTRARGADDAGMTTSEYAVGTVAACGFGAILYQVVTSDSVTAALESLVTKALSVQF